MAEHLVSGFTQGASLAYAFGEDGPWQLYTEPLRLPVGATKVRALAVRIGYKESETVEAVFSVEE